MLLVTGLSHSMISWIKRQYSNTSSELAKLTRKMAHMTDKERAGVQGRFDALKSLLQFLESALSLFEETRKGGIAGNFTVKYQHQG